jgi:hypothetical protein
MNMKQGTVVIILLAVSMLISGCGPGQLFGPEPTPTPTNTPTPTETPLPTLTPTPDMPTYSQVLSTYPASADLCQTDADITGGGDDGLMLSGTISMRNDGFVYQCHGTKLTVTVAITLDGKTYEPGAKLTVDKDLNWIEVSSWD